MFHTENIEILITHSMALGNIWIVSYENISEEGKIIF